VGVPLPLDNPSLKDFRLHAPQHSAKQAQEMQPWEWYNLLQVHSVSSGPTRIFVAFVMLMSMSCMRFVHFQRTTFTGIDEILVSMRCSQGKRRVQGARPRL
jgi:hypothetical protein